MSESVDDEIIINPQNDNDIKQNLICLLDKKREGLQFATNCHDYLYNRYSFISKIIEYSLLGCMSLSFVLSTLLGDQCSGRINIAWTVTTGIALIPKGIKQIFDYTENMP